MTKYSGRLGPTIKEVAGSVSEVEKDRKLEVSPSTIACRMFGITLVERRVPTFETKNFRIALTAMRL